MLIRAQALRLICATALALTLPFCLGQGCMPTGTTTPNNVTGPAMQANIVGPDYVLVGDSASYYQAVQEIDTTVWYYGFSMSGSAATMSSTYAGADLTGVAVGSVILTLHLGDPRYDPVLDVWGHKTVQVFNATINGPATVARGQSYPYTATVNGINPADLVFEWYGDFENTMVTGQSGAQATLSILHSEFDYLFGDVGSIHLRIRDASDNTIIGEVAVSVSISN